MTTLIYDDTGVYIDSLCNDNGITIDENFKKIRSVLKDGKQFNLIFSGSLANIERITKLFVEKEDFIESGDLFNLLVRDSYMFVHEESTNELNEYTIIDGLLHQFKCPVPYFFGSGRDIARGAYHIRKNPIEALQVAAIYDVYTNSNIVKV